MLNTWTNHFDIPIFNYYESFNDLNYMLKKSRKKKLSVANYEYLADKLMILQDWFACEIDETSYKATYKSISRLIRYKYSRHKLQLLLNDFLDCSSWCR